MWVGKGTVISNPIIVTTNNMFEKDLAFNDRQSVLNVAHIPMFTGMNKTGKTTHKPHKLILFHD